MIQSLPLIYPLGGHVLVTEDSLVIVLTYITGKAVLTAQNRSYSIFGFI